MSPPEDPTEGGSRRPNPYVGPRSIEFNETIYGRDREKGELRDLLIADRIVLMYSPSGAGKTSLVNAGLRPELEKRDFRVLPSIRVGLDVAADSDDGVRPNRYLLSTLVSLEEERPSERLLARSQLQEMHLDEYLGLIADDHDDELDPCLVFDQFEELVTLDPTDQQEKADFMIEVGRALRDRRWWALFVIREDFVAQLDPFLKYVSTRLRSRYRLDLLDAAAARTVAVEAAKSVGVCFAEDAAERLVDDLRRVRVQRGGAAVEELGPYVEPVQLQVVCRQLWNRLSL